jgi:hypothetical protein
VTAEFGIRDGQCARTAADRHPDRAADEIAGFFGRLKDFGHCGQR